MNREDIIRMAREAGFTNPERFITTDENLQSILSDFWENLERFAALVAAAEREACAKILDRNTEVCRSNSMLHDILQGNATAIRARGQS